MPRGKNYVNNNKGMAMQASAKKSPKMIDCLYGAGCTRPDCIYRHSTKTTAAAKDATSAPTSTEPCMAYLSGICSFTGGGCRKRHPPKQEAERLIAKYKRINCRHGDKCLTKGCLYRHPQDGDEHEAATVAPGVPSYAAMAAAATPPASAPVVSSWKPAQPGLSSTSTTTTSAATSNSKGGLSAAAKEWTPSW